jgi:hypothetical protein
MSEEAPDEDDPCNIQITEIEGEREVEGPSLESEAFLHQLRSRKSTLGQKKTLKWKALETTGMSRH